jgi:hypothetical protein
MKNEIYAQALPNISPEVQQTAADLAQIGQSADNFASAMAPIGVGILGFIVIRIIIMRFLWRS